MAHPLKLIKHQFRKILRVYTLEARNKDIAAFFSNNKLPLIRLFEVVLNELIAVKAQVCLRVMFIKIYTKTRTYFCSKVKMIPGKQLIETVIEEIKTEIESIADLFTERGSCCFLYETSLCEVRVGQYIRHKRGWLKNFSFILRSKKACINVKTPPNCFIYEVLVSLHRVKSSHRPSSYQPFIKLYNFTDFQGTVDLNQIKCFERKNNISINLYTTSNKDILPIEISTEKRKKKCQSFATG